MRAESRRNETSMFGHQQFVTVEDIGKVRKKDKRQEDKSRLQDIKLSCPLTPELAEDFNPSLLAKLWDKKPRGGGYQATSALSQVAIPMRLTMQIMTVTAHPEHDAFARIEGVGIKKIRAIKVEGDTWVLSFLCVIPYNKQTADAFVMVQDEGVYVTFEAMQGDFLEDEKPKRAKKKASDDEEQPELEEGDEAEGDEPAAEETPARRSRQRRRAVAAEND
jgi:hypothetical protein